MILSSVDARCTHTEEGFGGKQGQVGETGPTRRVRKTTKSVTSTSQRVTTLRSQGQQTLALKICLRLKSGNGGIRLGRGYLVGP